MNGELPTRLTQAELVRRGIELLAREFGPGDAARFITHFSGGKGDYTAERDPNGGFASLAELAAAVRARAAAGPQ